MKSWIVGCFLLFSFTLGAQSGPFDVTFEFQAYPTGLIPGIRFEKGFAEKNAISLRLGYQFIDHRDLGKNDDEWGNGYGFTVGYKRYFKENFRGLFAGIKNDVWWNEMEWKMNPETPDEFSGVTDITVIQPTAEAGYLFEFGEGWICSPTVAFGYEVNVKTEGRPTGEGAIFLLGFNLGRRF